MILITTPTGNTGHNVLATAIGACESVRTLARDPNKIPQALRERCEVITGDLRDEAALRKAAEGVRAVFLCVPQSGESSDVAAYYRSFAEPAARAFKAAQVARVVTISGGSKRRSSQSLGGCGSSSVFAGLTASFPTTVAH
jgi:uncharacterized protein YbjT (DUF2867 family)